MESIELSVIMSVYNGKKYLKQSIESVLSQSFTNFEFIIVNDASTDNSLAIIKEYEDPRIRLINNETNMGLTKSLNIALKYAKGLYIARQDADDISLPERFSKQMNYLEKNPKIALLGTSAYDINKDGNIISEKIVLKSPTFRDLIAAPRFVHGSVIYKKNIVLQLGGYDENFKTAQDFELWLRIADKYEIGNLIEPLYKLRAHDESITFKRIKESELYHLFAVKQAELGRKLFDIEVEGITYLCEIISKKEKDNLKKLIYKKKADQFLLNGKPNYARCYYKKIFSIDPLNLMNNLNIIRSFFGKSLMIKTSKVYMACVNLFLRFKNHF